MKWDDVATKEDMRRWKLTTLAWFVAMQAVFVGVIVAFIVAHA